MGHYGLRKIMVPEMGLVVNMVNKYDLRKIMEKVGQTF